MEFTKCLLLDLRAGLSKLPNLLLVVDLVNVFASTEVNLSLTLDKLVANPFIFTGLTPNLSCLLVELL